MSRLPLVFICCSLFLVAPVQAQLALPGAAPATAAGGEVSAPKLKKEPRKASSKTGAGKTSARTAKLSAPGFDSIADKPLMQNGELGLLQISGSGDSVQIDKLKLAGEGVSDPSQHCVVDIIGEAPIKATRVDSPDGLERFEVEVPACPFSFDVLSGAILVPSQITACVFKAADCQTSPGGLWGPDGASLQPEADAITKRRAQAEKMIGKALQALAERAQGNSDAARLLDDQKAFPGQRDDACHAYQNEQALGFCAANLTEARAAMLEARLAGFSSADAKETQGGKSKRKTAHKKKPAESAPASAAPAQD